MTTPQTLDRILENIKERFHCAEVDAKESHIADMNSYGAGYDRGFANALAEIYEEIAGERP